MSKNRMKTSAPLIRSRAEMEMLVERITLKKLDEQRLTTEMDSEIAAVKANYESQFGEIKKELKEKLELARAWAEAHPEEFGKKKSIDFVQAVVGFRTGTPKLSLLNRSWDWEKVLAAVEIHLPNFIRNKPEIDKEAIIAQRDDVEFIFPKIGVKVDQGESFYVEPKLTAVEQRVTEAA